MKLDEYVKQTLLDITNGVAAAQKESLIWIAPGNIESKKDLTPQLIAFEVAVTLSKEGGEGIHVWSLGELSAKGNAEHSNKISFSVPVYFQAKTDKGNK
jgi:hypothetical protein